MDSKLYDRSGDTAVRSQLNRGSVGASSEEGTLGTSLLHPISTVVRATKCCCQRYIVNAWVVNLTFIKRHVSRASRAMCLFSVACV
jgi:hypothetical protein